MGPEIGTFQYLLMKWLDSQLIRVNVINKQGPFSHTVDAISILLSYGTIFIDKQDRQAETKASNKGNLEGRSKCREQRK